MMPRLAPEVIERFILDQFDAAGLAHNILTLDALALIVRASEGLLHRPRNICLAALIEAVREQIRAARMVELAPLLRRRGLSLYDRNGGNWEVREYHGLVLKASYWHWPERNLAGNTIDFFTKVLGASFSYAMKEITNQP